MLEMFEGTKALSVADPVVASAFVEISMIPATVSEACVSVLSITSNIADVTGFAAF